MFILHVHHLTFILEGRRMVMELKVSDHSLRLCFNIYTSETAGYFQEDLGTISSHVRHNKTRYFKTKLPIFFNTNQVVFVPKP